MEKQPDIIEPLTPKLPYNGSAEDSGYHSSFTPGFFECSTTKDECSKSNEFPYNRRGIKRAYPDDTENTFVGYSCISTPTNNISGELDILRLTSSKKCNSSITSSKAYPIPPVVPLCDTDNNTIPTTPLKRICKSDCKLNSHKRNLKLKIDFNLVMHSISCEKIGLSSKVTPVEKKTKSFQVCNVKPHQKIDIIKMLHQGQYAYPALMKIFSYLDHEDIFIFTLVSQYWQNVWEDVGKIKTQEEHKKYLNEKIESQENRMCTPKMRVQNRSRPFMEIQNVCYETVPRNPPVSPKTIKYKRFMEAGTNGLRRQLKCMRCGLPARITLEKYGEEWAECIGSSCAFQFCSTCKFPRHPGKNCIQFDLNRTSPSKRMLKNKCLAATKESRRKLGRLKF